MINSIDAKRRRIEDSARISELEYEVSCLENFLQNHSDTEGIRELRVLIEEKNSRIRRLEYTVTEFENFLKENPDIRELRCLRNELTKRSRRIVELENFIERNDEIVIEKTRIMKLEEILGCLEDYVVRQNVDDPRLKLHEREMIIRELTRIIESDRTNVDSTNVKKNHKNYNENCHISEPKEIMTIMEKSATIVRLEKIILSRDEKILSRENEIYVFEKRLTEMRREIMRMTSEIANYEAQDIDVLKEEIRVRDERITMLEDEIDSLEGALSERIDIVQIEELVNVAKEKETRIVALENDLRAELERNDELTEALRDSVVITSEFENKLERVQIAKRNALERVGKLEQRMVSMQTACALKCQTCRPLLSQLHKSEKKLDRLVKERRTQLKDLRQIKREALRAALSEKDAHLALLELSGLKTSLQIDQADELRADKTRLLENLKQEDKESIEQSEESDDSSFAASTGLLTKILLEPPLAKDEDYDLENVCDTGSESEKEKSPDRTNGQTNDHGSMTKQRKC